MNKSSILKRLEDILENLDNFGFAINRKLPLNDLKSLIKELDSKIRFNSSNLKLSRYSYGSIYSYAHYGINNQFLFKKTIKNDGHEWSIDHFNNGAWP